MSASVSQFPPNSANDFEAPTLPSSPKLRLASSRPGPLVEPSIRDGEQTGRHVIAARPIALPRVHTITLLRANAGAATSFAFQPGRALGLLTGLLAGSFALALTVGWLVRAEPVRARELSLSGLALLGFPAERNIEAAPTAIDSVALPTSLPSDDDLMLEASARAARLGIGTVRAAQRLLMGLPEESWVAAAGDSTPTTLLWPVSEGGYVRGYGSGEGGYHLAVDVSGERGTPVRASAGGIVGYAGDGVRGYGNIVMLIHPGGWVTMYAHNQRNRVASGQRVARGEVIANLGSTGISRGPHVHYEFMHRGRNCDPAPLFRPGVMHRNGNLWVKDSEWEAPYAHDGTVRCAPRRRHPHSRYGHHEDPAEPDQGAIGDPVVLDLPPASAVAADEAATTETMGRDGDPTEEAAPAGQAEPSVLEVSEDAR